MKAHLLVTFLPLILAKAIELAEFSDPELAKVLKAEGPSVVQTIIDEAQAAQVGRETDRMARDVAYLAAELAPSWPGGLQLKDVPKVVQLARALADEALLQCNAVPFDELPQGSAAPATPPAAAAPTEPPPPAPSVPVDAPPAVVGVATSVIPTPVATTPAIAPPALLVVEQPRTDALHVIGSTRHHRQAATVTTELGDVKLSDAAEVMAALGALQSEAEELALVHVWASQGNLEALTTVATHVPGRVGIRAQRALLRLRPPASDAAAGSTAPPEAVSSAVEALPDASASIRVG